MNKFAYSVVSARVRKNRSLTKRAWSAPTPLRTADTPFDYNSPRVKQILADIQRKNEANGVKFDPNSFDTRSLVNSELWMDEHKRRNSGFWKKLWYTMTDKDIASAGGEGALDGLVWNANAFTGGVFPELSEYAHKRMDKHDKGTRYATYAASGIGSAAAWLALLLSGYAPSVANTIGAGYATYGVGSDLYNYYGGDTPGFTRDGNVKSPGALASNLAGHGQWFIPLPGGVFTHYGLGTALNNTGTLAQTNANAEREDKEWRRETNTDTNSVSNPFGTANGDYTGR